MDIVHRGSVDDGEAHLVEAVGGEAGEGAREALVPGRPALGAPYVRCQADIGGLKYVALSPGWCRISYILNI